MTLKKLDVKNQWWLRESYVMGDMTRQNTTEISTPLMRQPYITSVEVLFKTQYFYFENFSVSSFGDPNFFKFVIFFSAPMISAFDQFLVKRARY
jgi:hypothetical protein